MTPRSMAMLAGLLLLSSCHSYQAVPVADPGVPLPDPGTPVRVLTRDGESFRAVLAAAEGSTLTFDAKRYGDRDAPAAESQRARTVYERAEISSLQADLPGRVVPRWMKYTLGALAIAAVLVPPQIQD